MSRPEPDPMPGANQPLLELQQSAVSKSKPVEVLGWIASASTAVVGALALIDGVPSWVVGVVAAIGIVATKLLAYATTKQVTPWEDVVSKATPDGRVVAGPAANEVTPDANQIPVGTRLELPQVA